MKIMQCTDLQHEFGLVGANDSLMNRWMYES